MFFEIVTVPHDRAEEVHEHSRMFSDPPEALVAAIAWDSGDGNVTTVMLWDSPSARGDFAFERMMPLFQQGILGEEHGHPDHVTPLHVHVRG